MNTKPMFANEFTQTSRIIYTPSAFARSNLFALQETGRLAALKSYVSRREGLDSFLFFIVTEGAGSVTYRGKEYELRRGDCVFLNCRYPYSHCCAPDDPWQLAWVHFTGGSMPAVYEKYESRGGRAVFTPGAGEHGGCAEAYDDLLRRIYETAEGESYVRDVKINTLLSGLVELLMEETVVEERTAREGGAIPAASRQRFDARDVKAYMEEHYTEEISLDDLAAVFHINKQYLSNLFKAQIGIPVNACLTEMRITKAKGLLRYSGKTVEEIGREVGIGNPNYFSRVFKNIEGCSPGEYRKKW